MSTLIPVDRPEQILPQYRNTPIERLLRYHNLKEQLPPTTGHAELLVGMCMDNRKDLIIPNEFAYIIRGAGGNLRGSEFEISYAIAVGGVSTIALLAHTDCGMSRVSGKRDAFIRGLVERAGCDEETAATQFDRHAAFYQIGDSLQFVLAETARLRQLYPKILIAPFLYKVETDLLEQIVE